MPRLGRTCFLRAALLALALVCGCSSPSPEPRKNHEASASGLAPQSLAGNQLKYRDNHSRNIYTFFPDGRYRYASLSQNESFSDHREGRFQYAVRSNAEAVISFDDEPSITLRFTDRDLAVGTIDGDVRVYQFQIVPFDAP
jgi:hypothetical protein